MGLAVGRVGNSSDTVGGGMITDGSTTVKVNGYFVALHGSHVADHGSGAHNNATMVASGIAQIEGRRVVRAGDAAT
jgi:uncharacterized Zn-binding protein involved in type VI secretion